MEKITDVGKWIIHNFFALSIVVFILIYLRWFRLTPLVFSHYNDPNAAYIAGLILLSIYIISALLSRSIKNHKPLKTLLFISTLLFFSMNYFFLKSYAPSVKDAAVCKETLYYITYNHPFLDYDWEYNQVTKWRGILSYESDFFGYENMTGGDYKIVCDSGRNEVHIIDQSLNTLVSIDGDDLYDFDHYARAETENHLYFLSWTCNDWKPNTCGSYTYSLFECNKDYKSCNPLPISYTNKDDVFVQLKSNEINGEINMYKYDTGDETLVFTYGKHPRCYVEGCEIQEK